MAMVTVVEAAGVLRRSAESARKVIDNRKVKKHYMSGKRRFRVRLEDVVRIYQEIEERGR